MIDTKNRKSWLNTGIAAALLAISIGAVYVRALHSPFIFDDLNAINRNDSIRSLSPLVGTTSRPGPLNPPKNKPTSARPLFNLSLALNYHFGELDPTGYHVVNVVVHFLCAMFVWAIVRRTLTLPCFAGRFDTAAPWLALTVAMLWALHPLQTEAVAYTTQRSELLLSLFYLTTLYCSIRYWSTDSRPTTWLALAVVACLCGMASKESMVSAPLLVLLFDRAFIAGSFREALRKSWPLYAGLACTWLLLLGINADAPRGASAGFRAGVNPLHWWLTQCQVLLMYLKLAVWPYPLLIHYQWPYLTSLSEAWPYVIVVAVLVVAAFALLRRNSPLGFLAALFFAILAPTSIVPIALELAAERRMYLPMVALVTLLVVGLYWAWSATSIRWIAAGLLPAALLAATLGLASYKHLSAYDDEIILWREVLAHNPNDSTAHGELGRLLFFREHKPAEAIGELQASLKLKPDHIVTLLNLGAVQTKTGQSTDAIATLQRALQLNPDNVTALDNMATAQWQVGNLAASRACLEHLLQLQPQRSDIHGTLGMVLHEQGKTSDAIARLKLAIRFDSNNADAHNNLGLLLMGSGNATEAVSHLRAAVQLIPDRAEYNNNLGIALRDTGQVPEGIPFLQTAVRLKPDYWQAQRNLFDGLVLAHRLPEAISAAEKAVGVARSAGRQDVVQKLEEWLSQHPISQNDAPKPAKQ